ncbi:unnamed protein product [Camellia sinensis]
MIRGRLFFGAGYITLVVVVVHVHVFVCVNCDTNNQNQQQLLHKNSCGDIQNISFPFRLKAHSHDHCGNVYFELECENNQTVLNLFSGKYYVQAINYIDRSISLVDVGIQRNNCSFLPLHSLTPRNFTDIAVPYDVSMNGFATLVSCENSVKSSLYISTAACENKGGGVRGSSSSKQHSYVLFSSSFPSPWSDVANLCSVDMIFPSRQWMWELQGNTSSLLEVHNALAHGFDLYWNLYNYKQCRRHVKCFPNYAQNVTAGACHKDHILYGFWAFLV